MPFAIHIKHCLALVLLVTGFHSLYGQSYYFRHYQVENGLSHNTVFCAVQDQQGFMWFGTKDGLNRFDGNVFKVFRNVTGDTSSIGNNFVYALYVDSKNRLWAGTARGLYQYIRQEEGFRVVPGSDSGDLYDIREDSSHTIWFVASGKLYHYGNDSKTSTLFEKAGHDIVSALHISSDNKIWYGTYGRLNCYDRNTGELRYYNIFNHSPYTTAQWIRRIAAGPDGKLLIGTTDQGLKAFEPASGTYQDILAQNPDKTNIYVRDIIRANDSLYWIATESGIFIYDIHSNHFTNLKKSFNNPYLLSDNAVYTLFKDVEGGIWAGTYFGGVNYFRKQYTSFEKYFPDNTTQSISGNAVREICGDGHNTLWIGTEDRGLNKLNTATGKFTQFLPGAGKQSISYYNIHGLLYANNQLWVGMFEHGIDIIDPHTDKVVKHFDNNTPGIHNNFFLSFCQTKSGQILAGNALDLLLYHPHTDSFSKVNEIPGNNFVYHIMEDREETIWVSTIGNGLYFYNPISKQQGHFRFNAHDTAGISSNLINSTFEDSRGDIWIATEGAGLCRYNKATKEMKRFTTANGLPANFIFKILEDNNHHLWISTTRGLVQMNPDSEQMTVYTVSNGILNDQFNYNSGYKSADGRLYFGSVKGMISFNPQNFTENRFIPPIYITGLQIHNRDFVPTNKKGAAQSIITTPAIQLTHQQSSISIDFAALGFTAPEMIQYSYHMEGLQDGWTTINTHRKAYFTDLPPGKYRFTVKASGPSDAWHSKPASLAIEVLPAWWASKLAYFIYSMAGLALVTWIILFFYNRSKERNRRRMEKLAHEKEKELYEAKIEFFTQVAHEIKTPLTLIKAPLEKITTHAAAYPEIQKNLHTMQKNTRRLIDLSNQLLDFRLTEARGYRLHFERLNVSALVQEIYLDFKPIADQKKLTYSLAGNKQVIEMDADEDALQKILTNLFSNAIKYADKKVHITQQVKNDVLELSLSNDGFIIPEDKKDKIFEPFFRLKETDRQKGTGIGLALSRSLSLLHNGSLTLENNNRSEVNTFILRLPIHALESASLNKP